MEVLVKLRGSIGALVPFTIGTLLAGLACAWASAYLLPGRDPKFAHAPDAVFQLGFYFAWLSTAAAIVGGAAGVWLRGVFERPSRRAALRLFALGGMYCALPVALDAVGFDALMGVPLGLPYLLGVPAAATYLMRDSVDRRIGTSQLGGGG